MWRISSLPIQSNHNLIPYNRRHISFDIKTTNVFKRNWMPKPFEGKKKLTPSNMPHPRYMDGEILGYYSNMLARESSSDDSIWNKLISRSKQIYPTLEPKEIALILNSMARVRKIDPELFSMLCNQIATKAHFYSSVHVAMILAAYTKAKMFDPKLIGAMVGQIKNRLYEFLTPLEISMIIHAISKMPAEYRDKTLLNRLSLHVQCRLMATPFLPRELGQIAHSFATMDFDDPQLYSTIAGSENFPFSLENFFVTDPTVLLPSSTN